MGEIYAKIFIAVHIPFFLQLTYKSDPAADFFPCEGTNDTVSRHMSDMYAGQSTEAEHTLTYYLGLI